jgi:hypothetical protein
VRLDYQMREQYRHAFDYSQRPLWGKGKLDISFLPIVATPSRSSSLVISSL